HRGLFDRASIQNALDLLKRVDSSLNGILHAIDVALKSLLETANSDVALDFLTDVLGTDGGFELSQFETVKHDLTRRNPDRLFKLLVRWLISGNSNLGVAAQDLLVTGDRLVPFDTTTSELGLTGPDCEFLAIKALG